MTKTVKKRLQAVVALLVTLMIMVGIMPRQPFNTEVHAYFDSSAYTYNYYFDISKVGKYNTWTSVWIDGNAMEQLEAGSSIYGWGSDSQSSFNQKSFSGKSSPSSNSDKTQPWNLIPNHLYKLSGNNWDDYEGLDDTGSYDPTPADQTKRAYLAGVNYFNYYYDEQVLNTSNPDTMTITQGQAKSPYAYFNQAIMASAYGQDASNTVPMYLGEYWIGSGAESPGGSYGTQKYDANTAANVAAGIYGRPCGVTNTSDLTFDNKTVNNTALAKFKWGANLAYRGGNEASYHTVAQGLIDSTLSLNPTDSNYLIPTKNGVNVPYFDKNWLNHTVIGNTNSGDTPVFGTSEGVAGSDSEHHIGKVYTSTFPFYYEQDVTLTGLNQAAVKNGWNSSFAQYHGGMALTSNDTINLKCYTFDSLSDTVGVNKTGGMTENENASQSGSTITVYLDPNYSGSDDKVETDLLRTTIQNYLDSTTITGLAGKHVYDTSTAGVPLVNSPDFTTVNQITNLILADHDTMFTDAEIDILNLIKYFYDPGHVKDVDGKNGFFPFNKSIDSLSQLEYGFGVRLDIKFNIHKYGTEDGSDPSNNTSAVPEIFRFTGDDDVWVFIDGQLALDMGGGHKNAIGEINFQTKKTAIIYTAAADNNDTCNEWGSGDGITKLDTFDTSQSPAVTNVLTEILNEANTNDTHISNEHTLTFFYMERGKLNSNMSLMFNFYAPEIVNIPLGEGEKFPSTNPDPASDRKFSIREVTNFDNINPGLVSATKLIAEDDVFTYNVQNNTLTDAVNDSSNWGTERAKVPTNDVYKRTATESIANTNYNVETILTNGSQNTTTYTTLVPETDNYIYLDVSNVGNNSSSAPYTYYWKTQTIGAQFLTNSSGQGASIGTRLSNNSSIVKIAVPTANSSCTGVIFVRGPSLSISGSWFNFGENAGPNNQTSEIALNIGHKYSIDSNKNVTDDGVYYVSGTASYQVLNFAGTANTSTYGNVANTGYVWKDDLSAKVIGSDEIDGMTNQTNASGQFGLMYGTSAKESSAEFLNQFITPNWDSTNSTWTSSGVVGASTVKITQGMAKVKTTSTSATVRGTSTTNGTNNEFYVSQNERDLNHYYTSSAVLVDNTATLDNTVMTLGYTPATDKKTGVVGDAGLLTNDMTVWISNAPQVTDIIIHKTVTENGQEVTTRGVGPFTIRVNFSRVFGKNIGTNGAYVDYAKIPYYVGTGTESIDYNTATPSYMTADTTDGRTYGTFQIYANQTIHLRGIPIDSVCTIYEVNASDPSQGFTVGADEDYLSYQFIKDNNEGRVTLNNGNLNATVNISEVDVNNDGVDDVVSITVRNEKKPSSDGLPDVFDLEIQKIWILQDKDTLTDESISNVYFRLERSEDSGSTWSTLIDNIVLSGTAGTATYGGTTVTTVAETKSSNGLTVTWKATINNLAARSGQGATPYQYRLIEYGKGKASVILATGGAYSANCTADYTNYAKTADSTMNSVTENNVTTWSMVLSVTNTFSETTTTIDPKPLPKTGARGVYAIVTFGAFAITIAGVALLIYRKKLQTVNIYAVKGSEKPKE